MKTPTRGRRGAPAGGLPTKKALADFVRSADGPVDRREIARAFGVKGEDRAVLRRMLKELEAEKSIDRPRGKRYEGLSDGLPPVGVADIVRIDDEGDLVLEPANWKGDQAPPKIVLPAAGADRVKPALGAGDRVLARFREDPSEPGVFTADVIKRIGRGGDRMLGVFSKTRFGGLVDPVDKRVRGSFEVQRGDEGEAADGDLVWIETKNQRGYGPRKARVRAVAGSMDDRGAFSLVALANHGVPTGFSPEEEREAETAEPPGLDGRVDLRDTPLVTIDPADAKDHDDAIFAAHDADPGNKGGFRAIVAIADVSWFVRPGSALDKGALNKGNSTYLPDRVEPMLPERLSNDLCSLKEGVDRPCLALEMRFDRSGRKISHNFMRAMMKSAAGLSYEEAQAARDGSPSKRAAALMDTVITPLFDLYEVLLEARAKRSPLDLDLPERKLVLDDDLNVMSVAIRERFDAHKLVEELMIQANVSAAEALEEKRMRLIYRVHDAPDPEKLEAARAYLESIGYALAKGQVIRPGSFNRILEAAAQRGEADIVSEALLRAQSQAVYDTENIGHFGLNLQRYAHFTSPIRRYADLTVHRALVSACRLGPGGQTEEERSELKKSAEAISNYERRSMAAEREATDRFLAAYLEPRIGEEFAGRITGVVRVGVFVRLEETGADGFCPAKALGFEYFRHDEERRAMIGETSGAGYRLGQQVRVRLEEATPLTGGLRLTMLSDPEPVPKGPSGSKPTRKGSRKAPSKAGRPPRDKNRKR